VQGDAQQLRQQLSAAGTDVKELDQIMRELQKMDGDQAFVDPSSLQALQAAALEKLKRYEFNLRKKADEGDSSYRSQGRRKSRLASARRLPSTIARWPRNDNRAL